jgi:diguanylate cyclase
MTGTYDPRLVALAIFLAMCVAFTLLNVAQRMSASRGIAATGWLLAGTLALGAGLWSAQFFAMLAFKLPVPVVHHAPTMLFSLGLALVIGFFMQWITSGPSIGRLRLVVTGLCAGIGLAGVHYTGLFAMQIIPAVYYDPVPLAGAVGIATLVCWLALSLAFVLRHGPPLPMLFARAAAGLVVGAGLAAHFHVAMRAAQFAPDSYSLGASVEGNDSRLLLLAAAAALLLLVVLMLSCIDHARGAIAAASGSGRDAMVDRVTLEQRFGELHEAAGGSDRLIALMLVSVGPHGVAATQEAARRLVALVRPGDTVARLAENEFALLLPNLTEPSQSQRIAARVQEVLANAIDSALAPQVAARIGTSLYPKDGQDLDTLLRIARAEQGGN